jgi:histidinol phosphatase-like PHP family hydrolase
MIDKETPDAYCPIPSHDLHTHTIHCGHAAENATVPNIIRRANEIGLAILGISEHVFRAEEAGCLHQIDQEIRRTPSPTTHVLLGVEVDPDPIRADGSWPTHDLHVDYVILSPHMMPRSGLGAGEFDRLRLTDAERQTLAMHWLDWYERCIDRGGMDILGHPLREPIATGLFSLLDERIATRAIEVLSLAARRNIAFELNDAWLGNLSATPQFRVYLEIMQELKRLGIRFSRGSDAHNINNVGNCSEVTSTARQLGLTANDWITPADFPRPLDWEV